MFGIVKKAEGEKSSKRSKEGKKGRAGERRGERDVECLLQKTTEER